MKFEPLEPRHMLSAAEYIQLHHEQVLDFAHDPTTVTVADGAWSDAATWSAGIPDAADRVVITHDVTLAGDASADAIRIDPGGRLGIENATLAVSEVLVFGELEIENAAEIILAGTLDEADTSEHGVGIIVGMNGSFVTSGQHRTPFTQIIGGRGAGSTELVLSEIPTGWQTGDRLYLPDSIIDHNRLGGWSSQEYVTIAEVVMEGELLQSDYDEDGDVDKTDAHLIIDAFLAGDATVDDLVLWTEQVGQQSQLVPTNRVRLETPLVFDHGRSAGHDPHVANLTRDIVIRSGDPDGVRGHVLVTDSPTVDIRDAAFSDLGRTENRPIDDTNQIGRYSLHLHRLGVSGWNVFDSVVERGEKWGLAMHDSHFGTAADNVVIDFGGAGIVQEDGSETGNLISGNFVSLVHGGSNFGFGRPEPGVHDGFEGAGIWSRSTGSLIVGNVITNSNEGIDIWSRKGTEVAMPTDPDDLTKREYRDIRSRAGHLVDNVIYATNNPTNLRGMGKFASEPNIISGLVIYNNASNGIRIAYSGLTEIRDSDLDGRNFGIAITATFSRPVSVFNATIDGWKVISSEGRHGTAQTPLFDTNGDGVIDEEDLLVDLDGDGVITRDEFNSVFGE